MSKIHRHASLIIMPMEGENYSGAFSYTQWEGGASNYDQSTHTLEGSKERVRKHAVQFLVNHGVLEFDAEMAVVGAFDKGLEKIEIRENGSVKYNMGYLHHNYFKEYHPE